MKTLIFAYLCSCLKLSSAIADPKFSLVQLAKPEEIQAGAFYDIDERDYDLFFNGSVVSPRHCGLAVGSFSCPKPIYYQLQWVQLNVTFGTNFTAGFECCDDKGCVVDINNICIPDVDNSTISLPKQLMRRMAGNLSEVNSTSNSEKLHMTTGQYGKINFSPLMVHINARVAFSVPDPSFKWVWQTRKYLTENLAVDFQFPITKWVDGNRFAVGVKTFELRNGKSTRQNTLLFSKPEPVTSLGNPISD